MSKNGRIGIYGKSVEASKLISAAEKLVFLNVWPTIPLQFPSLQTLKIKPHASLSKDIRKN